jgi:hypothetical protein
MTTAFLSRELIEEISKESTGSGRYLNPAKIQGEVRVRLVGQGITGFGSWTVDKKPIRWQSRPSELPSNLAPDRNGNVSVKRFIASLVYDYSSADFKIMEITQKSLMDQLFKFVKDDDYGDPSGYDIKIGRTGEGLDTQYTLVAAPPKSLTKEITTALEKLTVNMEALFDGDDPFASPAA